MAKGTKAFVFIAVVIIGVVIVGAAIWNLMGNVDLGDFGGVFGGAVGDGTTGYSTVGFTLNFADGTSTEIRPEGLQYSLVPLIVKYEGKTLSSIDIFVDIEMTTQTSVDSWTTHTALQIELYKKPSTTPKTSSTATYDHSGASFSGTGKYTVASIHLPASDINSVVKSYGDGDWLLQCQAAVELKVIVSGEEQTYSASTPSGGIDFTYVGQTAMSITATVRTYAFSITGPP